MRILLVVIQLIVSAGAIAGAVFFRLGDMFAPSSGLLDATSLASLCAILICTVFGLRAARGAAGRPRVGRFALVLVLTLTAALAEPVVSAAVRMSAEMGRLAERAKIETAFASKLAAYGRDVDARAAARRPYAVAEALALVDFVAGSDLSNYGLADRSPDAFAILARALDAKLVDPNGLVQGPRAVDVKPVPLFLSYYQFHIQPLRARDVGARHWRLLALLVDHGADLTADGAERLASDLAQHRSNAVSGQ